MTLGELIRSKGYMKMYIHEKLVEKGVDIDLPHFSRWCNNHFKPRTKSVYTKIAEILDEPEEVIKNCFNK